MVRFQPPSHCAGSAARPHPRLATLALALLAAGGVGAQTADETPPPTAPKPERPMIIRPQVVRPAAMPAAGGAATITPMAQTLSAPVTLTANTTVDALTVTQTGPARAINGVVNRPASNSAAVRGQHNGLGSAVYGLNTGTTGPAGKFESNNATSSYAVLQAIHAGRGNAVQAVITNTAAFDSPAVLGQHLLGPANWGIGVEGDGRYVGVKAQGAASGFAGLWANSNGATYAGYFSGNLYSTGTVTALSFSAVSDRNAKDGVMPIDGAALLDKVAALPISSWHYKQRADERHIGPMAQDFRAAFGLGVDDRHIEMVDLGGVSLAAVQALKRQLDAREARIAQLESQNAALDQRLAALESAMRLAGGPSSAAPATTTAPER